MLIDILKLRFNIVKCVIDNLIMERDMPRLNNDQLKNFLNSGSIVLKLGTITEEDTRTLIHFGIALKKEGFYLRVGLKLNGWSI
ncbi:MAG: hypothetical protein CM1200mP3_15610 [Chloroflexota bacterium]|nr:MAG: hypothetical protein CM1200mP3_15610 [Chloroflexota bacterium]